MIGVALEEYKLPSVLSTPSLLAMLAACIWAKSVVAMRVVEAARRDPSLEVSAAERALSDYGTYASAAIFAFAFLGRPVNSPSFPLFAASMAGLYVSMRVLVKEQTVGELDTCNNLIPMQQQRPFKMATLFVSYMGLGWAVAGSSGSNTETKRAVSMASAMLLAYSHYGSMFNASSAEESPGYKTMMEHMYSFGLGALGVAFGMD